METILRKLRLIIYWGFPREKTAKVIPSERIPYQPRLQPVVVYAIYNNELYS